MTFEQATQYMASLGGRGWRLGLDRMQAYLDRAGLTQVLAPPGGPAYLHVAGTNGKGSVTAFAESLLRAQGYRTGGFFSPYVYDFRERVTVHGLPIEPEIFTRLTERLQPVTDSFDGSELGSITEFEFKTALGFAAWHEKACEAVALEVGLGGRLDATNVVDPAACAIVSIGWDHMEHLGDTLAKIASEKAGILKPGRPAVIGSIADAGARQAIEARAREVGAPLWRYGLDISVESETIFTPGGRYAFQELGLKGEIQRQNAALAVAMIEVGGLMRFADRVSVGLAQTRLPGRFQWVDVRGRRVILDGAHNVDAGRVVAEELRRQGVGDVVLVVGMLTGHDPAPFAAQLQGLVRQAIVTPIDFHRSMPLEQLEPVISKLAPTGVASDAASALESALAATSPGETIVVTGSFYLVGEVGRAIGPAATGV